MRNPYDYYITPEEYEIAERNGVCASTLNRRIRDLGWEKDIAITTLFQCVISMVGIR